MRLIFVFLFSLMTCLSMGQIQKGDWLVRGGGATVNNSELVNSSANIDLNLELGYFISDHWMAGAGLNLSLSEFSTFVGNKLFGRYYFRDSLSTRRFFYLEGRYERIQFAPVKTGNSDRRFNYNSGIIACGVDFFLSDNLAIETQLDYYFFNKVYQFNRPNLVREDFFTFNIKFQYFFRYRDFNKERLIDYRLSLDKGVRFLGGKFVIQDRDQNRFGNIQTLRPVLGVFIKKNLALGGEFVYEATSRYDKFRIGLIPFSRYYLNLGRKKKIFVEAKGGYQLGLDRGGNNDYKKDHSFNYGAGLGLSNFITEEVSFDIVYSFLQYLNYNDELSKIQKGNNQRGFSFVLQYYF